MWSSVKSNEIIVVTRFRLPWISTQLRLICNSLFSEVRGREVEVPETTPSYSITHDSQNMTLTSICSSYGSSITPQVSHWFTVPYRYSHLDVGSEDLNEGTWGRSPGCGWAYWCRSDKRGFVFSSLYVSFVAWMKNRLGRGGGRGCVSLWNTIGTFILCGKVSIKRSDGKKIDEWTVFDNKRTGRR